MVGRMGAAGAPAIPGLIEALKDPSSTVRITAIKALADIGEAAKFAPLEQLALSPQCGFASGIGGNALSMDAQWRKLDVMMETARKVWG